MGWNDDHRLLASAYWDRWIQGSERRAPAWFATLPSEASGPWLPSFDQAFDALMHQDYPGLHERLLAIFENGPDLPPMSEQVHRSGHAEAALWWRAASLKTVPGRSTRWDQAFDVANQAIEHYERQGVVQWGEEAILTEDDHWLFHRDSLSFWNTLRSSLESEQHRNYEGWSPTRSLTIDRLHRSLERGYAPWALIAHRSAWWWSPNSYPEHTAEHQRAESTLALDAWHWALTHQGPAPCSPGISQALSAIGMKDGWSWALALREIVRFDEAGWSWGPNHDGHDPRLHWLDVGRSVQVQPSLKMNHQARMIDWEGQALRMGLNNRPEGSLETLKARSRL